MSSNYEKYKELYKTDYNARKLVMIDELIDVEEKKAGTKWGSDGSWECDMHYNTLNSELHSLKNDMIEMYIRELNNEL